MEPMDIEIDPPDQMNKSLFSLSDPNVAKSIIDDLKSHGILDEARKACIAEVDSKPAYLNLQRRINDLLVKYLAGRCESWNPSVSKSDFRAQIRKYLERDVGVNTGIERIVDQTLSQRMYNYIEPTIEKFVFEKLGLDITNKDEIYEQSNGASKKPVSPSKMSTISSEEMEEAGEGDSSPGNQIRGNISPLTPQRKDPDSSLTKDGEVSDDASRLRGDISPLTPVALDKSSSSLSDDSDDDVDSSPPRTPPLPPAPKFELEEMNIGAQLSDEPENEMSPVSDVELEEVSPPAHSPTTPEECNFPSPPMQRTPAPPSDESVTPPPLPPSPPPPPPPMQSSMTPPPPPREILPPRPRSLLTSPIGSSSDEMESTQKSGPKVHRDTASSVSASDISDTDFACQSESEKVSSEEADLEELERTRAELQARLQAAHLEGSDEGELQSEEDRGSGTPAGKSDAQVEKELLSISPISDESETDKDSESETKSEHKHGRRRDDEDGGDNGGPAGGGSSSASSSNTGGTNPPSDDSKGNDDREKGSKSEKSSSSNDKEHKKSQHNHEHKKSHHRHHTSSGSSREDKHKQSPSGHNHKSGNESNGSNGRSKNRVKDKNRDQKKDSKKDDFPEKKESKVEREKKKEKDRMRLEKIESEISKKCGLKSERFVDIDMFAPKARPKMPTSNCNTPKLDRSTSQGSPTPSSQGSSKASGTPKGSEQGSGWNVSTPQGATLSSKGAYKTPKSDKIQDLKQSEKTRRLSASDLHREAALSGQSPIYERRVLPELPVPKCEGDKKQQHLSDFNDTKRLLEEARQRKLAEMKAMEEKKKREKQLLQAAQRLEGSVGQRSKQKQRYNSSDLVKPQRSSIDTNSDTSDGEWNVKEEKIVNRSISRKRQRSGKKRLSTSSEEDGISSENKLEGLQTPKRFHGFCRSQCDSSSRNRLKLCIAINFFAEAGGAHDHSSENTSSKTFGTTEEDSGIAMSDAEEEKVELKAEADVTAAKRPRLGEPEPAFEVPEEDCSMLLEESVENIMKEVAASKPEHVDHIMKEVAASMPEHVEHILKEIVASKPEHVDHILKEVAGPNPELEENMMQEPVASNTELVENMMQEAPASKPEHVESIMEELVASKPEQFESMMEELVASEPEPVENIMDEAIVSKPEAIENIMEDLVASMPEQEETVMEEDIASKPEIVETVISEIAVSTPEHVGNIIKEAPASELEHVDSTIKEVPASKPERIRNYGFSKSIRKELFTLSTGDLYGLGSGFHLTTQKLDNEPGFLINKAALEYLKELCKGDKDLEKICDGIRIRTDIRPEYKSGLREVSDEFLVEEEETISNDTGPTPDKRPRRAAATTTSTPAKVPTSPPASKSMATQQSPQVSGLDNRSPQAVTRPIFQPHASPSYSTQSSSLVSPASSPVQRRIRPKSSPQAQPAPQGFHRVVSQPQQVPHGGYQIPQPSASSSSNNNDSNSQSGKEALSEETVKETITRSGRRSGVFKMTA